MKYTRYAKIAIVALLVALAGCAVSCCPTSPTPSPLPSLQPTLAPTSAPTPMPPTPTSTPVPTLLPVYGPTVESYLRIASFDTCERMGVATPGDTPRNTLTFECIPAQDRDGIVARLAYETPSAWAAFWIGLNETDFSPYDMLTFFAKGEYPEGANPMFKLELKRQDGKRMAVTYVAGLTDQWKQFSVPLEQFQPFADMPVLCGWDGMSELVFTFEHDKAGSQGVIYLDDIYVERQSLGAPTPPPVCYPTLAPTLPPQPVIADFDSCTGVAEMGGQIGAAYEGANRLAESYVTEAEHGCVARLEYHIQEWSAFWLKLQGADFSPYTRLAFDIKADPTVGVPNQIKIELKRQVNDEISILYVSGITDQWQTISVNLSDFGHAGFGNPLTAYDAMDELVFTFEASRSGTQGVVYLDNIVLLP
jgi:hypothetical protein